MNKIRNFSKRVVLLLIFSLLNQVIFPTVSFCLTSGPTQPEASSFTPVGTTEMVDLFSGDFQYNIPLLDVGGYPINLAYNAGVGMDEEASWVGLGWNLNPGVINRQMRGVPDEFRGDSIFKSFTMRPDVTKGGNIGGGIELKGIKLGLSASLGMYHNTYTGYGMAVGINPVLTLAKFNKTSMNAGLGLNFQTNSGLNISPSIGLRQIIGSKGFKLNASQSINSRRGLQDLTIAFNVSKMDREMYIGNNGLGLRDVEVFNYFSGSGNISFGYSTYIPTSELPLKTKSFTFRGTVGGELFALNGHLFVDGYGSEQNLIVKKQKQAAYGYLNSQLARESDVMDFNRERQGLPWRDYTPVLPASFGTNDLFAASGQGGSGQYRAIRSDIGYFKDATHYTESESNSFGIELGFAPNLAKVGLDVNVVSVDSKSKAWTDSNPLDSTARFTDWDGKTVFEPAFFKNSGEMTAIDPGLYDKAGKTNAAQPDLETQTGAIRTAFLCSSNQTPTYKSNFNYNDILKKQSRDKRNDVWQYLTAKDAALFGLEKNIVSYKRGQTPIKQIRLSKDVVNCAIDTITNRTDQFKSHHISEVTIVKPDGARYVYGIPAYNTHQKEVSFSVNPAITDANTGLVQYDANDNSLDNNQGRDRYYSAEILPPYPYAFLLTGVLSPDYIDRTGNGITSDDYGSAVRINYSKNKNLYKWRTPVGRDSVTVDKIARYQPGRKSDKELKKASYIYGKKEVWYVHSIESATMVAQFYTSARKDGLGVLNENGGIDTDTLSALQKLDKIELYSKSDLQKYGNNATPIKTVHFKYDYLLCRDIPNFLNSGKRKLTLTRIYFTYGKSGRGEFNAYKFSYKKAPASNPDKEFAYNLTNVDRWGNYKVNPPGYLNTSEYPYALQDPTTNITTSANLHDYAGAWALDRIELPSGGVIDIEYESDDYAFVQNKRAGQMYFVKGFSKLSTPTTIDTLLYTYSLNQDDDTDLANVRRIVWIDLSVLNLPSNTLPDTHAFKAKCMQDIGSIWFNMDVKMKDAFRESITGYMDYDPTAPLQIASVGADTNLTAVGIPVKATTTDEGEWVHPVAKAALQTMRLELPALAYKGYDTDSGWQAFWQGFGGLFQGVRDRFNGFELNRLDEGNAKYVGATSNNNLKTSWIRLANSTFKKYGGGHRVKKVTLNDKWDTMTGGKPAATYGQTYSYTTKQKVKIGAEEKELTISSGVASWEPGIGAEENLWRQPIVLNDKIKLAPDNTYYVEKPFGESLFPAPMVGYSEVKVQNIGYAKNKRSGSGWTINKYYTARDFPTRVDYTAPQRYKNKSHKLKNFFKLKSQDHLSLTQGFVVEVNDMHGKPKEESAYAQNGSLISSVKYEYKVDNPYSVPLHLNNNVKVVTPDGNIGAERLLGLDMEVWQDFREESTLTEGTGFSPNTDGMWGFIIPIILFTWKNLFHKDDVRFRSAVMTKFVKRSGLLTKITKIQDGAVITTENLLWDSETGAVLATKTQNEFEDPIFQFTYPAHWVYDGMGAAYKNTGTRLYKLYFQNGIPCLSPGGVNPLPNYEQILSDGDELLARRSPSKWKFGDSAFRLTAYAVDETMRFYTDDGNLFSSGNKRYDLYMLRSGRRNMQNVPIGTIVSKTDPSGFASIDQYVTSNNNQVVDASAQTFFDKWQTDCACQPFIVGDTINPYRYGVLGNWRPLTQYVNRQDRFASKLLVSTGVTNIRKDGYIKSFLPFWRWNNGWEYGNDPMWANYWINNTITNIYDKKGNAVEEKDALGVYSTALYGYKKNLNTAVVHNAKLKQALFDGFEDYEYDILPNCDLPACDSIGRNIFNTQTYLSEGQAPAAPSAAYAHTGKYSLKVNNYCVVSLKLSLNVSADTTVLPEINGRTNYGSGPNTCSPAFKPSIGEYLISGWVFTNGACNTSGGTTYMTVYQQNQAGGLQLQSINASGPIIDGWQRFYGKVTITQNTGDFELRLINQINSPVYFDDIRMVPWRGNMKSFVYDPISLRLMATLDENNYATFYEYDDEGMRIRIKRETERGIMTIEETRATLKY